MHIKLSVLFLLQLYLVDVERQDEPLARRCGEAIFIGLDEAAHVPFYVLDVEHVVQAAVLVADQVKHQVAVSLVCVDVVKNHQGVPVETSRHCLSRRSVDDVKKGLGRKGSVQLFCRSALCQKVAHLILQFLYRQRFMSQHNS